jgi:hypothetical protein
VHGAKLHGYRQRIKHFRWRLWRRGFILHIQTSRTGTARQATTYTILDAQTRPVVADNLSLEEAEQRVEPV